MTVSRHSPQGQRILAEAAATLARTQRTADEVSAKHIDRLEREVASLRKQVDAIVRREIAAAKRRQSATASKTAPYSTRDSVA